MLLRYVIEESCKGGPFKEARLVEEVKEINYG